MSQNDLLASALSKIRNAEKVAKKECTVKSSKVIKKVLEIMRHPPLMLVFMHGSRLNKQMHADPVFRPAVFH